MQRLRGCGRLMQAMQSTAFVRSSGLSVTPQLLLCCNSSTSSKTLPKLPAFMPKPFMPPGTVLPYTVEFKGERLRLEHMTLDRAEEAWTILNEAMKKGEGYSRDEVETFEEFSTNLQKNNNYFTVIHEGDDQVLAFIILVNCPVARSEKTVHFAGPLVMNEKYRNKNYGRDFINQAYGELGRTILGHPGLIAARTVVAKSINVVVRAKNIFNGLIPNCSYLEGKGRIMDLIFTTIDPRHISNLLANAPAPDLPPLVVMDKVPEFLQTSNPLIKAFPDLSVHGLLLTVNNASSDDIWKFEEMIRQAAQDGDGFGIDEFTKDGHFNRKLLYESNVVMAKSSDDSIVAVAIFGASKLCRAYYAEQFGGYLLVNPEFRRRGIGSALANHLMSTSKEAGVTCILTDAYSCNVAAQQFMAKLDFIVTGTIPHSGYVMGKGYRHSYMFWRTV